MMTQLSEKVHTVENGLSENAIHTPYGNYPIGCFLLDSNDTGQVLWLDAITMKTEDFGDSIEPRLAAKIADHLNDAAGVTPAIREALRRAWKHGWNDPQTDYRKHESATRFISQIEMEISKSTPSF